MAAFDPQSIAVLKVYATCLSLGFRGMHTDASGAERLREILWSSTRRITEGREAMPLAPHWEMRNPSCCGSADGRPGRSSRRDSPTTVRRPGLGLYLRHRDQEALCSHLRTVSFGAQPQSKG